MRTASVTVVLEHSNRPVGVAALRAAFEQLRRLPVKLEPARTASAKTGLEHVSARPVGAAPLKAAFEQLKLLPVKFDPLRTAPETAGFEQVRVGAAF